MAVKILTLAQLNDYIEEIFDNEERLHDISVRGELGAVSVRGKTLFFTLKDEYPEYRGKPSGGAARIEQLACICFDFHGAPPSEGQRAVVRGTPVYSGRYGTLRFHALEITPEGKGELYERYLALRAALTAEGLFAHERKIPVPANSGSLCVITASRGAVVHDIIVTARGRNPAVNIAVYPVRVQGAAAAAEIEEALRALDTADNPADVLIIARGGGAGEDLEPFNTERVARAVAACRKPVISAVGHETDVTLCDLAADLRTATPTAAAVAAVADIRAIGAAVIMYARAARRGVLAALSARTSALSSLYGTLSARCAALFNDKHFAAVNFARRAATGAENLYREKQYELNRLKLILESNNPLTHLERGYAKILTVNGAPIGGVGGLKVNDTANIVMRDGTATARIEKINRKRQTH
jgi:exodeoxyribonuclease VII large subunit